MSLKLLSDVSFVVPVRAHLALTYAEPFTRCICDDSTVTEPNTAPLISGNLEPSQFGCCLPERNNPSVFDEDLMVGSCCESVIGDYFPDSLVDEPAVRDPFYSIP